MAHAICLSVAFPLGDYEKFESSKEQSWKSRNGRNGLSFDKSETGLKSSSKLDNLLPICLYGPQKIEGYRDLLKDCNSCSEVDKKALLKARSEEPAKEGPSRSFLGQKAALQQWTTNLSDSKSKVAGPLKPPFNQLSSSFTVAIYDS